MFNSTKKTILYIIVLVVFATLLPQFLFPKKNKLFNVKTINFSKNIPEKHSYISENFENTANTKDNTKNNNISSYGLEKYITKSAVTQAIKIDEDILYPIITTTAKVIVDEKSGKVIKVLDFSYTTLDIKRDDIEFKGGSFNINKEDDTRFRISITGNFKVYYKSFPMGFDFISNINSKRISVYKTPVMTLVADVRFD